MSRRGITAWIIEWDGTEHAMQRDGLSGVAAVLSGRLGAERVRWLTEQVYLDATSTEAERVLYARARSRNPYPAEFERVAGGIPWQGSITCGHNPWLHARKVTKLRAEKAPNGEERLVWEEIPRPEFPAL